MAKKKTPFRNPLIVLGLVVLILATLSPFLLNAGYNHVTKKSLAKELNIFDPLPSCTEVSRLYSKYDGFTPEPAAWVATYKCNNTGDMIYNAGINQLKKSGYTKPVFEGPHKLSSSINDEVKYGFHSTYSSKDRLGSYYLRVNREIVDRNDLQEELITLVELKITAGKPGLGLSSPIICLSDC